MSGLAPIEPRAPAPARGPAPSWHVRLASHDDIAPVAAAVRELLVELGAATPPPTPALEEAARALVADRRAGALLVAQADEEIVGVLGASWQLAVHIPGRYGLIQDLWVHPCWRGKQIGRELVRALLELALELRIARIEVGLPREGFPGIGATEAFYRDNGFTPLGPRMRRVAQ